MSSQKLARQGVRDLGGGRQRQRAIVVCPHVWEIARKLDGFTETQILYERCGACGETRGI